MYYTTKNTIMIEKPFGTSKWYLRISKLTFLGICLWWKTIYSGTESECREFAEKNYNVTWKQTKIYR